MKPTPKTFVLGNEFEVSRVIGDADIIAFADASKDHGAHHVSPPDGQRRMAHGLLTASIATEIGGMIDFLARTMHFEFVAPVWAGDTITCTARIERVERTERSWRLEFGFVFRNQDGEEVLLGSSRGIVRRLP